MPRNLEASLSPERNLLLYDDNGAIIGGLEIREVSPYISTDMLYRYCAKFLIFPSQVPWGIYHLYYDGTTGHRLHRVDNSMVTPGLYIVLDHTAAPIAINVTPEMAPRRVYSRSPSSAQIAREGTSLGYFRDGLRTRDRVCALSGASLRARGRPFNALEVAHIYPVNQIREWNLGNFRRWITDTSSPQLTGRSGLYSLQNGLLLKADIHIVWDSWGIAVDPDQDYRIIDFGEDHQMLGGRCLSESAIGALDPNHRVSADLLRWHLRMCILENMKGNAGTPGWEHDLGPDNMGEILDEMDGERMEAELSSRLGSMLA